MRISFWLRTNNIYTIGYKFLQMISKSIFNSDLDTCFIIHWTKRKQGKNGHMSLQIVSKSIFDPIWRFVSSSMGQNKSKGRVKVGMTIIFFSWSWQKIPLCAMIISSLYAMIISTIISFKIYKR